MNWKVIESELVIKPVRSGGPGGQHANKVSTKVAVRFSIPESAGLDEDEKSRIIEKLASKLTREHVLISQSEASRSQLKNKEIAIQQLRQLIEGALKKKKKRKATKPTKSAIEKRLKDKQKQADKKKDRRNPLT